MYQFEIVAVDKKTGSVLVRYYPKNVERDARGKPLWWCGPFNIDLPIDASGKPIAGSELLTYVSNMCPDPLIEREVAKRATPELDMAHHESLIGRAHEVKKTSPVIVESPREPAPQPISPVVSI